MPSEKGGERPARMLAFTSPPGRLGIVYHKRVVCASFLSGGEFAHCRFFCGRCRCVLWDHNATYDLTFTPKTQKHPETQKRLLTGRVVDYRSRGVFCFHSTMVRLKEPTVLSTIVTCVSFNSTMVRLKVEALYGNARASNLVSIPRWFD